jgi:hypothetical protein
MTVVILSIIAHEQMSLVRQSASALIPVVHMVFGYGIFRAPAM